MAKEFNIKNWQNKNLLNEQSFDAGLANAMGMSGDEFEDQVASRDIGDDSFGDTGSDNKYDNNIGKILQLIKSTGVNPVDVMVEIGEEFNIKFDPEQADPNHGLPKMDPDNWGFNGGTKYGDKMPGPGRGL